MADKPEERARAEKDRSLAGAGWSVQSVYEAEIDASRGVATREFPLPGHGFDDSSVAIRERDTRKKRREQLAYYLTYDPSALDRDTVSRVPLSHEN